LISDIADALDLNAKCIFAGFKNPHENPTFFGSQGGLRNISRIIAS
jgi:hypothetical protein